MNSDLNKDFGFAGSAIKSYLNKDFGFAGSAINSSGSDFRTDWNTIGDYSGLSGKPYDSGSTWSGDDKWKNALSKGLSWLASDKNKYRSQAERQPSVDFAKNTSGSGFQQIAPDISVFMPQQQQAPFTIAGGQSSGGGLGSALGSAAGFAAGMLIPGAQPFTPELMALGGNIGGSIG